MDFHLSPACRRRTGLAGDSPKVGAVEMNCFLCHVQKPDNQARIKELKEGRFQWAKTATLALTGLVLVLCKTAGPTSERRSCPMDGAEASKLGIREPTSESCGLCHGLADRGEQPLR